MHAEGGAALFGAFSSSSGNMAGSTNLGNHAGVGRGGGKSQLIFFKSHGIRKSKSVKGTRSEKRAERFHVPTKPSEQRTIVPTTGD